MAVMFGVVEIWCLTLKIGMKKHLIVGLLINHSLRTKDIRGIYGQSGLIRSLNDFSYLKKHKQIHLKLLT